jgi:predicted esterase YcpF (UPF0227 family)
MKSLLYLHGFRSSSASRKAQALGLALTDIRADWEWITPTLPFDPALAVAETERLARSCVRDELTLVGSSLGGFYAALVASRLGCRAVLLNPALHPDESLHDYLGLQTNIYTGEVFEFTQQHIDYLRQAALPQPVDARKFLLIVELGDELLDHQRTRRELAGAEAIIVDGGNHDLATFPTHIPRVLEFAGLPAPATTR